MSDLLPTEREVPEHGGVRVGDRVRLRAEVKMRYRVAGIDAESVEKYGEPGVVSRIVVSDRYQWASVEYGDPDDPSRRIAGPEDLEPAP